MIGKMYLPRAIVGIIAEFLGRIFEKRYRPIRGFEKRFGKRFRRDPYLFDYMVEKFGVHKNIRNLFTSIDPAFIEKLSKHYTEDKFPYKDRIFIFPIFYGKDKVREYLEKYSRKFIFDEILEKIIGGNVDFSLYVPLFVPLMEYIAEFDEYPENYSQSDIEKMWHILTKETGKFHILEKKRELVCFRYLGQNQSPGVPAYVKYLIGEGFVGNMVTCHRLSVYPVSRDVIYDCLQKYPANAQYYLEREGKIKNEYFMSNPHPDAVKYYIDRPEKITFAFIKNVSPIAVKYTIKNIRNPGMMTSYGCYFLSQSAVANDYLLEDPRIIWPRKAAEYNEEFGTLYEKHPEIFDECLSGIGNKFNNFHARDLEREIRETAEFLSAEVFY